MFLEFRRHASESTFPVEKVRKEGAKPGVRRWANVDEDARRARLYELTVPTRGHRSCNTWNTRRTHPAYVPRCTETVLASHSSIARDPVIHRRSLKA
ncbi:hypothetical protein WN51_07310 [Melipona quadrifasciata]|uniref:Uncharacterized protein n=1 Tax=Melipona quadrifasciata TaxID=166423 RepID=A0A0M8ZQF3_9HYME|nr:hypothetical protein WN51_07310 [Melipona quadrifasciata]